MSDTVKISGTVTPSNPSAELGVEIWVDNTCVIDIKHIDGAVDFEHDITDDEGRHALHFVLKHKQPSHTQIDQDGNIVQDAVLSISNVAFDGIPLEQTLYKLSSYTHDFNGSQALSQHRFYGDMGCNGTVSLHFTTPLYLWLLENM